MHRVRVDVQTQSTHTAHDTLSDSRICWILNLFASAETSVDEKEVHLHSNGFARIYECIKQPEMK